MQARKIQLCLIASGLILTLIKLNHVEAHEQENLTESERQFLAQIFKKVKPGDERKLAQALDDAAGKVNNDQAFHDRQKLQLILQHYKNLLVPKKDLNVDCSPQRVNGLLDAIKLHANDPQGQTQTYDILRLKMVELFSECKKVWDSQLMHLIDSKLSEKVREVKDKLLDSLVTISSGRRERLVRPYSRKQLERIKGAGFSDEDVNEMPPIAGIILYLSRFDGLNLDENMKNEFLDRPFFDQFLRRAIRPLCVPIQETLSDFINSRYQPFRQDATQLLDWGPILKVWILQNNDPVQEWLSIHSVCMKLLHHIAKDEKGSAKSKYFDLMYLDIISPSISYSDEYNSELNFDPILYQAKLDKIFEENRHKRFMKENGFKVKAKPK